MHTEDVNWHPGESGLEVPDAKCNLSQEQLDENKAHNAGGTAQSVDPHLSSKGPISQSITPGRLHP